ncbi:MAG TPA: hypothetical protein VMT03_07785 [Polyangia bacterium]|nr:hypothetical protein [Polyangia bacterium]
MHVALAPAYAIAILLPNGEPDLGCPSPRQLAEALSAHLPGVVLPLGRPPGPNSVRLAVATDAAGELKVDLTDPEGGPLLRRRVEPETGSAGASRTRAAECAALAETAALIVDRYWHEVGYEVPAPPPPKPPPPPPQPPPPPPPPPPTKREEPPPRPAPEPPAPKPVVRQNGPPRPVPSPAWWIAPGVGYEIVDRPPAHAWVSLAFALERAAWGQRLGLRLAIGARDQDHTSDGKGTVRQLPVTLGAYLALPTSLGRLELGLGVGVDVIDMTPTDPRAWGGRTAAAPGGEALLAWSVPLPHDVFIRAGAYGGAYRPYQVVIGQNHSPIYETPRMRLNLGLELGLWFR